MSIPCRINPLGWVKDTGGLPAGFTPLEYLENQNSAYANLQLIPDSSTYVSVRYAHTATNNAQFIIGANPYKNGVSINGFILIARLIATNTSRVTVNQEKSERPGLAAAEIGSIEFKNGEYYRNGELIHAFSSASIEALDSCNCTFILFGQNNRKADSEPSTAVSEFNIIAGVRIYSAEVTNRGKHIKLVPCLDNVGAPCFYDLVNRECIYASGSGDFTYAL